MWSSRRIQLLLGALLLPFTVCHRGPQRDVPPGASGRGLPGGQRAGDGAAATARRQLGAGDEALVEAVAAGAGVHGVVTKAGPLDPRHWHSSVRGWRARQRDAWVAERQRLLAAGAGCFQHAPAAPCKLAGTRCALLCCAHCRCDTCRTRALPCVPAGGPPPPLPLLSSCQVFVNHLYKAVYLRHAKTASSSLLCHFNGCREPREGANASAQAETSFQHLPVGGGS